jgi:hypothetical protein
MLPATLTVPNAKNQSKVTVTTKPSTQSLKKKESVSMSKANNPLGPE